MTLLPHYPSSIISLAVCSPFRLRVVPHFSSGIVERAKRERAGKSRHARKGDTRRGESRLFSRGVILRRARVSLALISLRKNGGLLVVYSLFLTLLTPKRKAVRKLTGTFNHHPTSSYITDELTIEKPSDCS